MVSRFVDRRNLDTSAISQQVPSQSREHREKRRPSLPFIAEHGLSRKLSAFWDQSLNHSFQSGVEFPLFNDEQPVTVLKVGVLFKIHDEDSRPGPAQRRRFRLTDSKFEYFHHFSQVRVKHSYPLTSIKTVDYDESSDPKKFHLNFSNCVEIFQAQTVEDAKEWVEKIVQACAKWHVSLEDDSPTDELSLLEGHESTLDAEYLQLQSTILEQTITSSKEESSHERTLVKAPPPLHRRFTCPQLTVLKKLERFSFEETCQTNETSVITKLAKERLYPMTKYPRHNMISHPTMKLFKLDTPNMQVMWKRNHHCKFHRSKSLSLHRVVEVREGQRTEAFDRFPFERAKKRSFSIVYQTEDTMSKYARLESLDLISDCPQNCDLWIEELRFLTSQQAHCSTYPRLLSEVSNTDTTITWLRQIWSCKVDRKTNMLHEKDAIKLAKKINPHLHNQKVKRIVKYALLHIVDSSCHQSLDFTAFLLMFNLLHNFSDTRLLLLFSEYCKTFPRGGLTLQEFREFLVTECHWQREDCTKATLRKLMQHHDSQHLAYKKYAAYNKPSEYVACQNVLSFAGFVSFLRSQDNPTIDPEHETVYQDMTQPLSHYFINSSHNTYLEGDQLRGKSSTDAYIRALLQGCRCVEIDCWNDGMNTTRREPIIYHGYTFTTKLSFNKVIQTIRDYAFSSSNYPVIVSTENHCNKTPQAKMAMAFRDIFKEMLPKEDLVELEGRERLPSPQELQGKIILKGSYKRMICREPTGLMRRITSKLSFAQPGETPNFSETSPTAIHTSWLDKSTITPSRRVIHPKDYGAEQDQDEPEGKFIEAEGDLKSLIIYAKATSIKPWCWNKQQATSVTQMFSFGECKAAKLCTNNDKCTRAHMLACTERQLVRTYPKGTRVDSSNYDPLPMWRCGVQMVALNFQYPDIPMHLNQGFFRLNGGCGYVLKPAVMRREDPGGGSTPFDPEMQTPHPDVPPIDLEIELITGQRLCPWKKKCSSVVVAVETYGIPHDCASIKTLNHDNVLWTYWEKEEYVLRSTIYMPELCLVYFRVETDKKLFAQNCISAISLQPGIKFIPLRTPGGELIPGSGLFVQIKKTSGSATSNTTGSSDCDDQETLVHQEDVLGEEIVVVDVEEESAEDEDRTLTEENFEPESDDYWSTVHEEEEQTRSRRRRFSIPASLKYTDAHHFNKESMQLDVIAEVLVDAEDS